jgi:glycosyltransferase involved in cell wall biosynthesis
METTICDPSWIKGINRMDLTLTSSEHSKETFLRSKFEENHPDGRKDFVEVNKPIEVLFEGVFLDVYKPIPHEKNSFKNKELFDEINSIPESFAFLTVGHWMQGNLGEDRKNIGFTIKSFLETFKNVKNPPALILKTSITNSSYTSREVILKKYNKIRKTVKGNLPNVYLLHGDFTDEEMNEIYNHPKIKTMVSLTKGEGFGRPLLEFSLTKKPIMVSNWSGHLDFLKSEFNVMIGGHLKNVDHSASVQNMILRESHWFTPDPSQVGNGYKDLQKNYNKHLDKASRQAYYSKTNFSHEKMTEKLNE